MNILCELNKVLENNLSEFTYNLWSKLSIKYEFVWSKPVSSTNKYHKRSDSRIYSVGEHTYDMLICAIKTMNMWKKLESFDLKTRDILLLGIAIHDLLKYGKSGSEYTDKCHDRNVGDLIDKLRPHLKRFFLIEEIDLLETLVRYHQGIWSTDLKDRVLDLIDFHPLIIFVHTLDMLSSRDCLKSFI